MSGLILTELDLSRYMIYDNMKLPVDMSSSDRYKISLQAQSVSLYDTKKSFCIDNAAFISFVRPLGKLRTDIARGADENGKFYPDIVNDNTSEMDRSDDDSRWGSGYERGRTAGSSKSSPGRRLSKSQAFENMYRIAAARQPSPQRREVKTPKLYSKRVIQLPMFKLNLKTYVGEKQDTEFVENARQSLKEMMDVGRNTPNILSDNTEKYKIASAGKEFKHSRPMKGQHIFRELSNVTPSLLKKEKGSLDQSEPRRSVSVQQGRISVADTVDTDKMDVRFDSMDIKTWRSSESSDAECDTVILDSGRKPKSNSEDAHSVSCSTPTQNSVWPSFNDIKRLRGESVQKQSGSNSKTLEMRGRHLVSTNPYQAVQNWVENHDKPVLRYTSKQSKIKLEPIVVPSHTCGNCPMCNRISDGFGGATPCPPNSPTLDEVLDEVALANGASIDDTLSNKNSRCIDHNVRFADKPVYIINQKNQFQETQEHGNNKKVRNGGKIHQPTVLTIPRVTVKILASKEQLQEATCKINYTKGTTL